MNRHNFWPLHYGHLKNGNITYLKPRIRICIEEKAWIQIQIQRMQINDCSIKDSKHRIKDDKLYQELKKFGSGPATLIKP